MTAIFHNNGNYVAIVNGRRVEGGLQDVEDAIADANTGERVKAKRIGVRCPRCGRKKAVIPNGDVFHCTGCHADFDDDPSEGGDYFHDPTKRIERRR